MADPFGLNEREMLNDPRSTMSPRIVLVRDGNAICARLSSFVNLQESPAGFASTIKDAVKDLLVDMKRRCCQPLWWGWGGPAGTCGEPAFTNGIHPNTLGMILCEDIGRCPKHGGFSLDAGAELAMYYRIDKANRTEALDWEIAE